MNKRIHSVFQPGTPLVDYFRLMRLNSPVGTWLLLWPCWWSIVMATDYYHQAVPSVNLLFLFAIGAVIMRSAGCVYNDIVDRHIDAQVLRTSRRPIPDGRIPVFQAYLLSIALILGAAIILLFLNTLTILFAIASLPLIALYPFMKRITWWPQVFLGITFNWGAFMGWVAVGEQLQPAVFALYAGCVSWTMAYDTIYAHQDKEDDLLIGVKSTAIIFGESTKIWVCMLYAFAFACYMLAGYLTDAGIPFIVGLLTAATYAAWKLYHCDIRNPDSCLATFRSSNIVGITIFLGILIDMMPLWHIR